MLPRNPTTFRAVTPSDSTDVSAIASAGLYVTANGNLYVRGINDTNIVSLGARVAGDFVPGHFSRVGASTTATVIAAGY